MDRAELAAVREELAALRRQVEANDRELCALLVNLAGEVARNRAAIAAHLGGELSPLDDAPKHALYRLCTDRPLGVSC